MLYTATGDNRTRDHHQSLDGTVVRRGTKEHGLLKAAVTDVNCRCSLTPLSESDAVRRGVKVFGDLPDDARTQYAA